MLRRMKSPQESIALPLDYAAEIAFEMHLMRSECCDTAQQIVSQSPLDQQALEECAWLDEALGRRIGFYRVR